MMTPRINFDEFARWCPSAFYMTDPSRTPNWSGIDVRGLRLLNMFPKMGKTPTVESCIPLSFYFCYASSVALVPAKNGMVLIAGPNVETSSLLSEHGCQDTLLIVRNLKKYPEYSSVRVNPAFIGVSDKARVLILHAVREALGHDDFHFYASCGRKQQYNRQKKFTGQVMVDANRDDQSQNFLRMLVPSEHDAILSKLIIDQELELVFNL